jgi:hypothetical protein
VAYELRFVPAAAQTLARLANGGGATAAKLRKVRKALGLLQTDPMYPSLHSHLYHQFPGLEKSKVWDSYVDHRTSNAWRMYWMYGPNEVREGVEVPIITVVFIGPRL